MTIFCSWVYFVILVNGAMLTANSPVWARTPSQFSLKQMPNPDNKPNADRVRHASVEIEALERTT